jgi:hypothetical protein
MARLRLVWAFLLSIMAGNAPVQAQGGDDAAWQAALALGSAEAFEEFLRQHPTSRHAAEAFGRLVTIETIEENRDVFGGMLGGGLLGSVSLPGSIGTDVTAGSFPLAADLFPTVQPGAGPAPFPGGTAPGVIY